MTRIAFPIMNATSREDRAHGHFGKASAFYIVNDVEDPSKDEIIKNTSDHFGGVLSPPDFLAEQNIDVMITIGMGKKAIDKFQMHDVAVYQMGSETIGQVLQRYRNNTLVEMTEGCSHSHHD